MPESLPASFSLAGRVALVTGSTTGLGRCMAKALGQAGAKVALNYANNAQRAQEAFAEFQAAGHQGALFQADVTNETQVERMIAEISATLGPVDIMVLNATCDQPQKPIEEYDWAFYQRMLDFFVKSPFLLTQQLLPHWKQQRWGRIINITSEVFQNSVAPFSAYVAAKGAQVGWSRSVSRELAPHGITVNMVAPGWIPVERHEKDPQEAKDAYLATIPMKRWGIPDDVANAVLYLASNEASFVTGQTICVNGGNSPW